MPPLVPRKRLRDDSPDAKHQTSKKGRAAAVAPPRKATLYDDLDATTSPQPRNKLQQQLLDTSEDESSLTSLSDGDFEDVPTTKRQKDGSSNMDEELQDDDDDIEFEDVFQPTLAPQHNTGPNDGALELTLSHIPAASYTDFAGKRGPSKNERRIRIATHCMHVQFLMWHNATRNSWLCDPELQGIMMSHLPPGMWDEISRFGRNSGLDPPENTIQPPEKAKSSTKIKGRGKKKVEKPSRDWGNAAERLEKGAVDMSFGDPLFRLLNALSSWWRKRFRITAPGIRKMGYMQTKRCTNLVRGFEAGSTDTKRYGERVSSLQWLRLRAQTCSGSRDIGAQLFTALLRALGLDVRMVANLQPTGFGFNKLEDADEAQGDDLIEAESKQTNVKIPSVTKSRKTSGVPKQTKSPGRPLRQNGRRNLKNTFDGSEDDDLALSSESDDDSVVEIPPLKTSKLSSIQKRFDTDLEFPHYWSEVLSPATNKYVPVDALVKSIIGSNRDHIESFEPRGAKADKAKQIMAYVVGFSDDGTAKDVTVRYLKNQIFPGRTKGMRMPPEKIAVHNENGKVKRYDYFDWFKSVMRGYTRGGENHPLTDIDYEEDFTDLKPAQPQKKEVKEGEETLQYYKQSKEFVLARHLKREEALLPTAKPVKTFKASKTKGKKGKGEDEGEPVYLRKDVVQVKSEETWHKQGRAPKPGMEPLKRAPYRAATTNRRRELAEAEAQTGHKVLQGLYSYDQTDWIIPPPIRNGIIPKNQYGNIDLFVEHMLPEGAAHVPYRGAGRVCKRLEIDFAEAVVDFEFGHRMAVPVIQGVVIAEEHFDNVMEELAKDEAEKKRKEDEKRRKVVLAMWRRLLMGMRIRERVQREYGEVEESTNIFSHSTGKIADQSAIEEDMAGGFLPEGYEEEDQAEDRNSRGGFMQKSSFFPAVDDDDDDDNAIDDGLVVEDGIVEGSDAPLVVGSGRASAACKKTNTDDNAFGFPRRRTTRKTVQPDDKESKGEDETYGEDSVDLEASNSDDDDSDDDYVG